MTLTTIMVNCFLQVLIQNIADIDDINTIKADPTSSFNIIHTNIASIDKHFDELSLTLSLLDVKFDLIGITEHKIKK